MVVNFEEYMSITKKTFYVSTLTLMLSIALSTFVESVFLNAIFLLSFGVTALIVVMAISLFVLYWVGWTYRKVIVYKSVRKERGVSERKLFRKVSKERSRE